MEQTVGGRIREARKARGRTQQDVADALGLSRPSVLQWEKDITSPSQANLLKLCDYLAVGIDDLLTGSADTGTIGEVAVSNSVASSFPQSMRRLIEKVRNVASEEIGFETTEEQALRWLIKKAGISPSVSIP